MTSTSTRPLLLGHRGARRAAKENTLPAFALALEHGCDGFEFDLRRSADGRSVICHDPKLQGRQIARETFQSLSGHAVDRPARRSKSAAPDVFSLEDVLGAFAERAFLDIELKVSGLEDCVLAALRERPPQRGYVVSSFVPEIIESLCARAAVPTGLICDQRRQLARWPTVPAETIIPHRALVSRELVEQLHTAGKKVFVWTVNQRREMLRLAEWGVDAIISDDTELLARTFPERSATL